MLLLLHSEQSAHAHAVTLLYFASDFIPICCRLKVSKVLVDLQIENTSLLEAATDKEFHLENKLLQQENDVMELEMAGQSKQKRIDQLERERRTDLQLIQDLKNELSAVRNNYTSVLSDLDSEKVSGPSEFLAV